MAEAAQRSLPFFDAQGLANTAWALTSLGFAPEKPFLEEFAEAALQQLDAFDAEALSSTLWSFASLGSHPGESWMERFGCAGAPRPQARISTDAPLRASLPHLSSA